ncbi:MAG TPA: hypothetical protein VG099_13055 [Gemmataceae bacterium]|nr:hypothetical protein [Gemmataceae bacterium]
MSHADPAYTLISPCRIFTRRSTGLSFLPELWRLTGLGRPRLRRLSGLRRLGGLALSDFHGRTGLLRRTRAFLSSLRLGADRERHSQREG